MSTQKAKAVPVLANESGSGFELNCVELCDNYNISLDNLQEEIEEKFTEKKENSLKLAKVYQYINEFRRSAKVIECGSYLEFRVSSEGQKLQHANFCKDRLCPMCNWRRSMKIFSQVSSVMDKMQDYEFVFLTLTVKNCKPEDLPKTIQALYDGWRYLYHKNSEFRSVIKGTFRSLEVTKNEKTDTFHPHLHCILAVLPSYFKGKGYITQRKWSLLWGKACKLEYIPIVHIQKVKPGGKGLKGAVAEASKYAVKGIDYVNSAKNVRAFLDSLSGRRLCGWTGVFAKIRKDLKLDDAEDGDLIITDGETIRDDVACMIVRYFWKNGVYCISSVENNCQTT